MSDPRANNALRSSKDPPACSSLIFFDRNHTNILRLSQPAGRQAKRVEKHHLLPHASRLPRIKREVPPGFDVPTLPTGRQAFIIDSLTLGCSINLKRCKKDCKNDCKRLLRVAEICYTITCNSVIQYSSKVAKTVTKRNAEEWLRLGNSSLN